VRDFSADPVPLDIIDAAIEAAGTAPSGANRQPWRFVVVRDPEVKRRIREAAEMEEREFYERRATPEWLADLAPLGTDWRKPFLEQAPALIAVFRLDYEPEPGEGGAEHRHKNYYVPESVGIAVGMLLVALHTAGLATLTHTPSPMGFLGEVRVRAREVDAAVGAAEQVGGRIRDALGLQDPAVRERTGRLDAPVARAREQLRRRLDRPRAGLQAAHEERVERRVALELELRLAGVGARQPAIRAEHRAAQRPGYPPIGEPAEAARRRAPQGGREPRLH
jgi:hypothetical protein